MRSVFCLKNVLIAALFAFSLAACGGGDDEPAATTTTPENPLEGVDLDCAPTESMELYCSLYTVDAADENCLQYTCDYAMIADHCGATVDLDQVGVVEVEKKIKVDAGDGTMVDATVTTLELVNIKVLPTQETCVENLLPYVDAWRRCERATGVDLTALDITAEKAAPFYACYKQLVDEIAATKPTTKK